jgi:RNA-binding protein YlmH
MIYTKTLTVPPVLQLRHIRNVGSASLSLCEVAVNKALQTLQKSLNLAMLLPSFRISIVHQNKPSATEQASTPMPTTTHIYLQ